MTKSATAGEAKETFLNKLVHDDTQREKVYVVCLLYWWSIETLFVLHEKWESPIGLNVTINVCLCELIV